VLHDIADDLASVGAAAPSHVESAFVRFLNEIVDSRYVAVASPEDFLLYAPGESGRCLPSKNCAPTWLLRAAI
jgi:hypothetical protein